MTELEETLILAEKLLVEPRSDPDDDLRMLARQLKRQHEAKERYKQDYEKATTQLRDSLEVGLIHANRDQMLKMHEEAVRRVGAVLRKSRDGVEGVWAVGMIGEILKALNLFHPMHDETWPGWPEGTE